MENDFIVLKDKFKEEFRAKYLKTLETFQVNVVLAYRLLENLKEFPEKTDTESKEFSITIELDKIDENVKADFRKWIIMAGFDELFKWIKELLIDYVFLKEAINKKDLPSTVAEFNERKTKLYNLHIPTLIENCKFFIGDLSVLDNFRSYNNARNCLHHGNEVLMKKFCTRGKDILEIKGRRLLLISDNGKETRELGSEGMGLENGAIQISAVDFCIEKKLNERIEFSLKEFYWMKDLAIFLYAELATDLFGQDDRPLMSMSIAYQVINKGQ